MSKIVDLDKLGIITAQAMTDAEGETFVRLKDIRQAIAQAPEEKVFTFEEIKSILVNEVDLDLFKSHNHMCAVNNRFYVIDIFEKWGEDNGRL